MAPARILAARWAVAVGGTVVLALYFVRYPPEAGLPPFDPSVFSWPEPAKMAAVARALGLLLAFNLSAWTLGGAVDRRWRGEGGLDDWALPRRLGLGLLLLSNATLLLAALHLLYRPVLAGLVVLPIVFSSADIVRSLRASWQKAAALSVPGVVAAIVFLVSPLLAAFVPDYGWDGFTYHLAIPERYLFENGIVVSPFSLFTAFPQLMEMLYLLALAFDPGPLAKLLHLEMGVLTAALVFLLARRTSRRAGLLALAVLLASPVALWELRVAYNDLTTCFYALLALTALVEALDAGRLRGFALCGLFAGACTATRYTGATIPLALAAALWLPAWGNRGDRLRASLTILTASVVPIAPWLIRNAIFTGNPVAPALQGLFQAPGHEFFPSLPLTQMSAHLAQLGMGKNLLDLVALPWNLTLRARPGVHAGFGFLVGPLFLIGTVACLLSPEARRATPVPVILRAAAVAGVLWFYTFQEPRYLLPALAFLAVASGIGFDALLPRRASLATALLAIPAAAVFHAQWTNAANLPYWYGYALGPLSVEEFGDQEPSVIAARHLRDTLGPRDRVLLVFEGRGFFFRDLDYIPSHTKEGSPVLQLIHEARDAATLGVRLRELGITHVLVNTNMLSRYPIYYVAGYQPEDLRADLQRLHSFLETETTPVFAERGVLVRRLRHSDENGGR